MAKRKGALKSNNSDLGWNEKHKQNEIHDRKMLTNEMNDANVSLAVSSRDSHIIPNLECQKITHTESSPPDIFNNSSSLKYLHKKFKRVASTVIEDNFVKISTNVNKTLTECASKFDATIVNNVNGEAFAAAANDDDVAISQSHINKPEPNNSHVIEKYSEPTNVPAKRDQNLVNNESINKNNVLGVELSGRNCSLPKENDQQSHELRTTDFSDDINKCKNDGSFNRRSTNTQNTINCESLPEDFRTKTKTSTGLPNFDENLVQSAQYNLSIQSANVSINSKSVCSSSNIEICRTSVTRKPSARRKNNERPYQCTTCGIELKSKSQLYKHCRSANHDIKSGNFNSQLPNEDVDLDISQSTSSDLELSSCSATTNSDIISRSATPPEETPSTSFMSPSALNYMISSQVSTHSIASLTGPDKPYKPKFHKAVFYHSNANINNNTNSTSCGKDSKSLIPINRGHDEETSENPTISHTLSTQSVEYLKQHISKIISQNEAIMEGVEPALQKKYHKIIGIPRNSNSYINMPEMHMQTYEFASTSAAAAAASPLPTNKNSDEMQVKSDYHEPSSIDSAKAKSRPFPTLQQQAQQALKKSNSETTKSHAALNLSIDLQPLNLSNSSAETNRKKQSGIESIHLSSSVASTSNAPDLSTAPSNTTYENHHPQNPERSIIKSLLLNSRGLAVPTTGEGEDAVYICPLCNISFRSADNLQYHTKCYCQGTPQVSLSLTAHTTGSPHSAPISPVGSPSHKYFRSNSFNLYHHSEKYSPNTLAKLASSSLRHRTPLSLAKLAAQQAAGYYLNKVPANAASLYTVATLGGVTNSPFKSSIGISSTSTSSISSIVTESQSVSSQCIQITKQLMDASLPSPGPLLGKTRLVDHYNAPRMSIQQKETAGSSVKMETAPAPIETSLFLPNTIKATSKDQTHLPMNEDQFTPRGQKLLQMCGGDVTIVEKTTVEKTPRFGSSGGSIVSISSSSDTIPENSPLSIRSGLLSGGSIIELPPKRKSTTSSVPISPGTLQQSLPNLSRLNSNQGLLTNYFQFPSAINSITAYNPLTLPPSQQEFHSDLPAAIEATKIIHGGKIIPFVPGIPGPNSLSVNAPISPRIPPIPSEKDQEPIYNTAQNPRICTNNTVHNIASYQSKSTPNPISPEVVPTSKPQLSSESIENSAKQNLYSVQHHVWPKQTVAEKSFNFTRIADNISPPKTINKSQNSSEPNAVNLAEKTKPKTKPFNQMPEVLPLQINTESSASEPSQMNSRNAYESTLEKKDKLVPSQSNDSEKCTTVTSKPSPKFLRPCSLPLKPGTFTPKDFSKKHHGITPTANTLPLISPETPRPSKHCVQLYLNGHAYTYLGLKCSTKTFYCTVNRPQPVYAVFAGRPELSMYSNWQTCAENNPHPLGFSPKEAMSLYDSRPRTHNNHQGSRFTVANKQVLTCAASDKTRESLKMAEHLMNNTKQSTDEIAIAPNEGLEKLTKDLDEQMITVSNVENLSSVPGGYKSNDDYTYVRGRGRGRYVCIECGMRCIKPCTLKKHIRTVHSDIRPYSCRSCMFSFKTKGNLTKHMESKAHYKKCVEKGLNPNQTIEDTTVLGDGPHEMTPTDANLPLGMEDGDIASDDYSEGDDMESSDNDDVKLPDHEAAHCLLSLSQRSPSEELHIISPKSLVPSQPNTYPYLHSDLSTVTKTQSNPSEVNQNQHDVYIKNDLTISRMGVNMPMSTSAFNKTEMKQKRNHMDCDAIDLSKPRNIPTSADTKDCDSKAATANAHTSSYAGAAELLKSLMKLSDKVPAIPPPTFDLNLGPVSCNEQQSNLTNNQMQSYLTERALQKSKIKLSQVYTLNAFDEKSSSKLQKESGCAYFSMLSKKLDHIEIIPKPRTVSVAGQDDQHAEKNQKQEQNTTENVTIGEKLMQEENKIEKCSNENVQDQATTENTKEDTVKVELHIINTSGEIAEHAKDANDQSGTDQYSGIETLAEIAANSVKLDALKSTVSSIRIADVPDVSTSVNTLFITSNKSSPKLALPIDQVSKNEISAKNIASEYLKLANEQDSAATVDDSSASSDSDVMADGESKQTKRSSSMMSLGPEVLISARTVVVGEDGFKSKSSKSNELPMVALPRGSSSSSSSRTNVAFIQEDGGPSRCKLCPASFPKRHQLVIHMNIHYMNPERKYRCDSCGQNFQTQGRLQKHMRTETHNSKVSMAETQGHSKSKNPRPFECSDCSRAFRIHGHLAKHLRSKTHVQKLECLQKLPFGTYAMIEEARINLTDIDTTDCDNSLASLKALAEKLKVESSSVKTIKKRKLDDGYKETLTIGEGDDS